MTDLCGVDSCRYVLLSKKLKCPSCLEKHVVFQSLHVFLLSNPEEMSSHCCPTQRDQYNWYIIDQFLLVLGFRGIQSSNLHHPAMVTHHEALCIKQTWNIREMATHLLAKEQLWCTLIHLGGSQNVGSWKEDTFVSWWGSRIQLYSLFGLELGSDWTHQVPSNIYYIPAECFWNDLECVLSMTLSQRETSGFGEKAWWQTSSAPEDKIC